MGCSPFNKNSDCGCSVPVGTPFTVSHTRPNPDPKNYSIIRCLDVGDWCVAEVKYPDATNYEGHKIMVYHANKEAVRSQTFLDPHFCDNELHLSPFARFEPTDAGWNAAILLAQILR